MLKIIEGNLFDYAAPGSIIAHGCNMQGRMGSGFADEIRRRFPLAFLYYWIAWRKRQLKLGMFIQVYCGPYSIYNLITQEFYGRDKSIVYVDYEALKKSLEYVARDCQIYQKTAHLPFIGGGLANGDRDKILGIFKEVFAKVDAMLYLKKD